MNPSRNTPRTLLAAALSLFSLSATQGYGQTATTTPVGYLQQVVTPATDTSTPSSQILSVPFYSPAAYAAAVTSVDSAISFSSSSASWDATNGGGFAQTTAPYLAHMKSGTSVGRYFLIQSNTATQLTVVNRGHSLTTGVAVGDTFEIVPAATFASLFGASSSSTPAVQFQTGTSASTADTLSLWNGTNFDAYYNNGNNWKRSGSLASQNNTVIFPDEGLFLTRRSTSALTLTFIGTVPSTTESSDVPGAGTTFLANRFPVDTTILGTGIQTLPNWVNGTTANAADDVYVWNGTNWNAFYYNGTHWKRSGSLSSNLDTTTIPAGSAVLIVRQSAATGDTSSLAQALPYSLN